MEPAELLMAQGAIRALAPRAKDSMAEQQGLELAARVTEPEPKP
jgi:hypothetical protein